MAPPRERIGYTMLALPARPALRLRIRSWAWVLPFVAAGAFLRLRGIGEQILGGDELHAIRMALRTPLAELPITYGLNDHSPPLAVLFGLLLRSGLTISELALRAPALASGVALVLVGPLLAERLLGRRRAAVFGALLAVSPLLVLYGRVARSYAPIAFLGFSAALASYRWLEGGRRGPLVAYLLLAPLTIYFHLLSAPFVLAPFLFAAIEKLRSRGDRPSWRALFAGGAVVVALVACFLVPARRTLLWVLELRVHSSSIGAEALLGALELQAGSRHLAVVGLFWLAAGAGLAALWRERPRLAGFTLTLVAGQVVSVLWLSPTSADQAIVANRYVLITLPVVLLWASVGIVHALERLPAPGSARLRGAAALALVALLFLAGPLPGYFAGGRFAFLGHNDFVTFQCPQPRADPRRMPAFYTWLRSHAPGETLAEFPWGLSWYSTRFPYVYQEVHGHGVIVATPLHLPEHPRLRFRNAVAADPAALLASRAGFLVVHRRLIAEEGRFVESGCSRLERGPFPGKVREVLSVKTPPFAARLRRAFGEPLFADPLIEVWDLRALRAARGAAPPSATAPADGSARP